MKVKYIYDFIDSFAPFRDQCEWDNSGLLLMQPSHYNGIVMKTAVSKTVHSQYSRTIRFQDNNGSLRTCHGRELACGS